jgi:hypothetical protein
MPLAESDAAATLKLFKSLMLLKIKAVKNPRNIGDQLQS